MSHLAQSGPAMLTIRSVETLDDYWLRLTSSDRTTIEREVSDLLRSPAFERRRTGYAEFRRARVRHGTVEWPEDLDLAPETLATVAYQRLISFRVLPWRQAPSRSGPRRGPAAPGWCG